MAILIPLIYRHLKLSTILVFIDDNAMVWEIKSLKIEYNKVIFKMFSQKFKNLKNKNVFFYTLKVEKIKNIVYI